MIEIGSLVRYNFDGDIGLVIEQWTSDETGICHTVIKWSDGTEGDHLPSEFEVLA
jgi:hypothetical protein